MGRNRLHQCSFRLNLTVPTRFESPARSRTPALRKLLNAVVNVPNPLGEFCGLMLFRASRNEAGWCFLKNRLSRCSNACTALNPSSGNSGS
jgi:hypothetical protein